MKRINTYWYRSPRGLQNEYHIGIATSPQARKQYRALGFRRILHRQAMRDLVAGGDAATRIYCQVSVDYRDPQLSRFELAYRLRRGQELVP